jgi:hypothetical protein
LCPVCGSKFTSHFSRYRFGRTAASLGIAWMAIAMLVVMLAILVLGLVAVAAMQGSSRVASAEGLIAAFVASALALPTMATSLFFALVCASIGAVLRVRESVLQCDRCGVAQPK